MDANVGVYMQHFCNKYARNNYSAKAKTSYVRIYAESSRTDTFIGSQESCEEGNSFIVSPRNNYVYKQTEMMRECIKNGTAKQF